MSKHRRVDVRVSLALLIVLCVASTERTAANDRPTPLATLELGYLQNSGWIVITRKNVLIFDYVATIDREVMPDAAAPRLQEYEGRRLVVFVTHSHADHFSPAVFDWAAARPDIQYVLGSPVPGMPPTARVMGPHEDWTTEGLRVRTTGSTDEGVGFLVAVDGVTLFHAGDLARWDDSDAPAFDAEILWLKGQGASIDLALFPIATGFACDPRPSIWKGLIEATRDLRPRVLVPMHVRCVGDFPVYERFRADASPQLAGIQVVAPTQRGQWFRYSAGVLEEDDAR